MNTYINVAEIIISVALILIVMLQVKGGGLGGIFGSPDSVYRAKRGLEKTMFQLTVALTILFIAVSLISLRLS